MLHDRRRNVIKSVQIQPPVGHVTADEATCYEFGPFRLDPLARVLRRGTVRIPIQPICFDLLLALLRSNHHTLTKDELIAAAWPDAVATDANLAQHVLTLRKLLGSASEHDAYIATLPKFGYRFVARTTQRSYDPTRCFVPGLCRTDRRSGPKAQSSGSTIPESNFVLCPFEHEVMDAAWNRADWVNAAHVRQEISNRHDLQLDDLALEAVLAILCDKGHLNKRTGAGGSEFRAQSSRSDFAARAVEQFVHDSLHEHRDQLMLALAEEMPSDEALIAKLESLVTQSRDRQRYRCACVPKRP